MRLLERIKGLRGSRVGATIRRRLKEFRELRGSSSEELFKELCFCILTANFHAEGGIRIQKEVGEGFLSLTEKELAGELRRLGYRFPNTRAKYIVQDRKFAGELKGRVRSFGDGKEFREWLVENVKGLGYKEASHFLRNIGYGDVAIVDFHIVDLLAAHGLIGKPKTMTKRKYLEIEKVLEGIAGKLGMGLGELDLYLWYIETGKVLK